MGEIDAHSRGHIFRRALRPRTQLLLPTGVGAGNELFTLRGGKRGGMLLRGTGVVGTFSSVLRCEARGMMRCGVGATNGAGLRRLCSQSGGIAGSLSTGSGRGGGRGGCDR